MPSSVVSLWALVAALVGLAAPVHAVQPTPLAFSDFFKRPVGPRGLEPTERLLSLRGEFVQLEGFLARGHDDGAPLIVSPVPVHLTDEDEALADDLPPAIAYVQTMEAADAQRLRGCSGRVRVIGRLDTGAHREADERISYVRLRAAAAQCLAPSNVSPP